jgi:hypothetical protein
MSDQPTIGLRPPEHVMRLARLGSMHSTRLSFLRVLLRRARAERWKVERTVWSIDDSGFGHAVYTLSLPTSRYSLVAFSQQLEPERRTDRVIAEAWDTAYVLYDGVPDAAEIARLQQNAPKQEAGRYSERDLVLSRANKSVRLFDTVARALASGCQPDRALIESVGYLMRTTAVYGNGKFGIADRARLAARPEFAGPFQAEMLTVWLIRAFTVELVEHVASRLSPSSVVKLDPALRRRLGIGNSTGLGMAPFLVRHPALIHRWVHARETALARVRNVPNADSSAVTRFRRALDRARGEVATWKTDDVVQADRIGQLREDLERLSDWIEGDAGKRSERCNAIYCWAEANLCLEAQEYVVSLLIESHPALVDQLSEEMAIDEEPHMQIAGHMPCTQLAALIDEHYDWALAIDFSQGSSQARFWYVSAEKLEPRLGERQQEPGAELEQPLTFARDVKSLKALLSSRPLHDDVATFLLEHPQYRQIVRRVQLAVRHPYAEIRDNLLDGGMRPIDLLRCKLSFFGATRFDPRSDRWLRICLFQDAPFPAEILQGTSDDLELTD